ncbi:hypothetical protein F5Y08DRAFT_102883 [Xylaria arbuscula]|nr:hypothetical protein F5Y08DRAFT_102883 [Xylaria arbuscula]
MCTTVIFQYKCGCSEPVVFECPFSSPPIPSSGSSSSPSESLRAHAHRNCSKRYRLQQEKLYSSQQALWTTASNTSTLHAEALMLAETPVPPLPKPSCVQIEKGEEKNSSEIPVTELDELCHDCWQHELELAKQAEAEDEDEAITGDDDEGQGNGANSNRILREIFSNELVRSPHSPAGNANRGVSSSAESFPPH